MNRLRLLSICIIIGFTSQMFSQVDQSFEIQAINPELIKEKELIEYYEKFSLYIKQKGDSKKSQGNNFDEKNMIKNFILFSEDGLIMKDLKFHSIESLKEQINKSKSELCGNCKDQIILIPISMESHVNKSELIGTLKFLKKERIDYKFENEDNFTHLIKRH